MSLKIRKNIPLIDQHDKNFMYGGKFGGNFIPETLKKPIDDLTKLFEKCRKDKKPFIIKWLRDNKHTGLIKNEIIAQVGKGKDNVAADVCAYIENAGLDVTREENIHTGSFKALVKDDIEKGKDVPLDELGVSRVIQASLKEVT